MVVDSRRQDRRDLVFVTVAGDSGAENGRAPMVTADAAALARRIYDAFNRSDFAAVLAETHPEVEVVNVGWGVTYRGHEGFREFMQGWKTMDPNCRVEVVRQLAGENGVANECLFSATHVGPLRPPTGEVPPTGRPVQLPFCEIWRLKDGKLVSLINYADGVTVLAQLGLLPPP
jgi:predicted ester cyclase